MEKAQQEKAALEREQQRIRDDDGDYFRGRSIEELQAMLNNPKATCRYWLIKEILEENLKTEKTNENKRVLGVYAR